jgi:hypothetical protein
MSVKNLIQYKKEKCKKETLQKINIYHSIISKSKQYKNIILDIDKTLIEGYFSIKDNCVLIEERPHLKEFLTFVFDHFEHVSIWTNANKEWYDHVYHTILRKYIPYRKHFHFVITFDDGLVGENNYGPKKLDIIFDIYSDYGYYKNNTFLVDDSEIHFQQNITNCYLIKPFEVDREKYTHKRDSELLKLIHIFTKK